MMPSLLDAILRTLALIRSYKSPSKIRDGRDTARLSQRYPPIARYGVFGVSTWPIGCDTPSPFSEPFPLGEHAKWRCDTPPQKGYLSDTRAILYENKGNGCDTPLCDGISKGYCAIWGVSRTGPLSCCSVTSRLFQV